MCEYKRPVIPIDRYIDIFLIEKIYFDFLFILITRENSYSILGWYIQKFLKFIVHMFKFHIFSLFMCRNVDKIPKFSRKKNKMCNISVFSTAWPVSTEPYLPPISWKSWKRPLMKRTTRMFTLERCWPWKQSCLRTEYR